MFLITHRVFTLNYLIKGLKKLNFFETLTCVDSDITPQDAELITSNAALSNYEAKLRHALLSEVCYCA